MSVTAEELEIVIKANVTDAIKKLEGLKGQIQKTMSKTVEPMQKVNTQVAKSMSTTMNQTSKAMGTTASKMDIVNREIELQTKKVEKLRKEMQKYNDAQKKMSAKIPVSVKGKYDSKAIESYTKNPVPLRGNVKLPKDVTEQLKKAEIRLEKLKLSAQKTAEQMDKKLTPALKKTSKTMKETGKNGISVTRIFKRMTVSMVAGRVIRGAISQAIAGIGDLAKFSDRFNGAMSEIQSSFLWLRNSMTTALTPIIEGLAPTITKVTDALSELFITITMYTTALFTNSKTYTRAKKATTDYAKSLDGVAKAQERALAGFDELNVLAEQNGTGMPTPEEMFEEVAIPEKVLSNATKIKQVYEELKPILLGLAGAIAGFKVADEITKISDWAKGLKGVKTQTDNLTGSMLGKNRALREQTAQTAKETSKVLQWGLALSGATVGVKLLQKGINKLKEGFPLNAPIGEVTDFGIATAGAGLAFDELKTRSGISLNETGANLSKFEINTSLDYAKWCENIEQNSIDMLSNMQTNFEIAFNNIRTAFNELMSGLGFGTETNTTTVNVVTKGDLVKSGFKVLTNFLSSRMDNSGTIKRQIESIGVLGIGSFAPGLGFLKLLPGLATGGVLTEATPVIAGEYPGAKTNPEIVSPQSLMYETNVKANIPVINAVEEMSDRLVGALGNIGVYAEFGYDKLKVGLDAESKRTGKKLYSM